VPEETFEFDEDSYLALLRAGIDPMQAHGMLREGWPVIRMFPSGGRLVKIGRVGTGEYVQIDCDEIDDDRYLVVGGAVLTGDQERFVARLLGGDLT